MVLKQQADVGLGTSIWKVRNEMEPEDGKQRYMAIEDCQATLIGGYRKFRVICQVSVDMLQLLDTYERVELHRIKEERSKVFRSFCTSTT